jgi:hypothetical protein
MPVGIPDKDEYGYLKKLPRGRLLTYVVQQHDAKRAGRHHDVRLGDRSLSSFAVRKGVPVPGKQHLAIQQPLHERSYVDFEGTIPSGYGAGTVKIADRGQVIVTKAGPDSVSFTTAHKKQPEDLRLVRIKDRNFLLRNTTPTERFGPGKPKMRESTWEREKGRLERYVAQPKIDGALVNTRIGKAGELSVQSHRMSKSGQPIMHTQRVLGPRPVHAKLPEGTVIQGEAYAVKKRKALGPQETSSLLNRSVVNSLRKQREEKIQMRIAPLSVNGSPTAVSKPPRLPKQFSPLPTAKTPKKIERLYRRSQGGRLTNEGIVLYPKSGGTPVKVKNWQEEDVYVREIGPRSIGYSLTSSGPVTGRMTAKMPDEYKGRIARVRYARKKKDRLQQPSLIAIHESR